MSLSPILIIFIALMASEATAVATGSRAPRFISFDSDGGKIDIDLDLSVPFLSIPLDNKADGSHPGALINLNTKAITVAGIMAAITAFVIPLFFNNKAILRPAGSNRYRLLEDDWDGFSQMSHIANDLLLGNDKVGPCIQRSMCSLIKRISKTPHQTSSEKIIDGITSLGWFKRAANGTVIEEAVEIGRDSNSDCLRIYNKCSIPATNIFDNLLDEFDKDI